MFEPLRHAAGRLFALGCLAGVLVAVGCDKNGRGDEDFRAGENASMFTYVLESDPETFDPAKMSGAPEGRMAFQLFEGLMAPAPTTENLDDPSDVIVPGVAREHEVSDDKKTYTFHLREDARWSDGEPVTAHDFAFAWKRVLDPDTGADYVDMLHVIDGAKEFTEGKADFDEVGVEAVDDHTLEVELEDPTPYFLELTAFYTFFPAREDLVEEHGEDWTDPENLVVNGAYQMTEYLEQKQILLEKNEEYWEADEVDIEEAKARIIADRNAVTNAYRSGELHWSGTSLPVSQISSFVAHPDYRQDPMLGVYFFRINVSDEDSPLAKKKVRQALAMSLDRTSLVEDVLSGLHKQANNFVPPMTGWESSIEVEKETKEARELLEEAGYEEGGKELPKIELLYNTDEDHKLIAEAVQKQWSRTLG
ncbi:MAG: peptide ABC transporter substrate-binding protein, partial [Persicimonas sp.]